MADVHKQGRSGYLRPFDEDLGGALDVIADLVDTGAMDRAAATDLVWSMAESRVGWINEAGGETALHLVDQVQCTSWTSGVCLGRVARSTRTTHSGFSPSLTRRRMDLPEKRRVEP